MGPLYCPLQGSHNHLIMSFELSSMTTGESHYEWYHYYWSWLNLFKTGYATKVFQTNPWHREEDISVDASTKETPLVSNNLGNPFVYKGWNCGLNTLSRRCYRYSEWNLQIKSELTREFVTASLRVNWSCLKFLSTISPTHVNGNRATVCLSQRNHVSDSRHEILGYTHIGPNRQVSVCSIMIIFLSISQNKCFGCSKEPSPWDGSFEYPQHMFWLSNKKLNL